MYSKNKKVNPRNYRHLIKWVVLAVFALAAVFAGFKIYSHYHNQIVPVTNGPTPEQIKEASDVSADDKKNFIDTNPSKDSSEPSTTPPVTSTGIAIDLTAKREADSSVTVIARLPGVSSGTCSLMITNGAQNTTKTASVIYQPEFSTCAGFSIPAGEVTTLGTGTWTITLTLTSSPQSGSKSITLEVT